MNKVSVICIKLRMYVSGALLATSSGGTLSVNDLRKFQVQEALRIFNCSITIEKQCAWGAGDQERRHSVSQRPAHLQGVRIMRGCNLQHQDQDQMCRKALLATSGNGTLSVNDLCKFQAGGCWQLCYLMLLLAAG